MIRITLLLLVLSGWACQNEKPASPAADPNADTAVADTAARHDFPANPWINAGCTIVTDEEVERIFNIKSREVTLNTRSLPDQAFCLRTWNKPDWKERETNNDKGQAPYLDPQNRLIIIVIDYHTPVIALEQFKAVRRDRRHQYAEDVPNLGEDALWSTELATLLVKKDRFALKVSLEHVDDRHDNLEKAKEVAVVALGKFK